MASHASLESISHGLQRLELDLGRYSITCALSTPRELTVRRPPAMPAQYFQRSDSTRMPYNLCEQARFSRKKGVQSVRTRQRKRCAAAPHGRRGQGASRPARPGLPIFSWDGKGCTTAPTLTTTIHVVTPLRNHYPKCCSILSHSRKLGYRTSSVACDALVVSVILRRWPLGSSWASSVSSGFDSCLPCRWTSLRLEGSWPSCESTNLQIECDARWRACDSRRLH